MRRIGLLLVLLVAIGAAVWFFFLRAPAGQPPQLASQVSQTKTLFFATVEHPDALLENLLAQAQKHALPEQAKVALDPSVRTGALGFDPAKTAGWQSIGVDPARGVALVLDTRMGRAPYFLLRITDEAAFLKWLGDRTGVSAKLENDTIKLMGGMQLAVARRGEYTILAEGAPPALLKTIAETKDPTLDQAPGFGAVFQGASKPGRVASFAATRNLKNIKPLSDPKLAPSIDFYADLFPAVGGVADADNLRVTLATTEAGRAALQQVFAPRSRPPAFSKWVPATGFGALRISGNLREFFDGVQALLPPAVPATIRGQVGLAKIGLAAVGIDWTSLTEAFTGHAVIAFKPSEKGPPAVLGLVALGNAKKADQLISNVEKSAGRFLKGMGNSPVKTVTIEGLTGRAIKMGGITIHMVRADNMLIVASDQALAADAIRRGKTGKDSLAGTQGGALLDSDAVFAFVMDIKSMLPANTPPEMAQTFANLPPVQAAVRLEKHGMVLEGQSMTLLMSVGMGGYLFVRKVEDHQDRAREAMERVRAAQEAKEKQRERLELKEPPQ